MKKDAMKTRHNVIMFFLDFLIGTMLAVSITTIISTSTESLFPYLLIISWEDDSTGTMYLLDGAPEVDMATMDTPLSLVCQDGVLMGDFTILTKYSWILLNSYNLRLKKFT